METIVAGTVATNLQNGDQTIGVRVWIPAEERTNIANLKAIQIVAPDGHKFALGRVADFEMQTGQPEITRDNLKRMVAVTARIEGRDLGSTVADVKKRSTPALCSPAVPITNWAAFMRNSRRPSRGWRW